MPAHTICPSRPRSTRSSFSSTVSPRTMSALTISGPPPAVDAASAVRAKDLLYRTALAPGARFTGPVLLVDDTIRTRWTATVAAALLADAGATSVLPLAIHQLPEPIRVTRTARA